MLASSRIESPLSTACHSTAVSRPVTHTSESGMPFTVGFWALVVAVWSEVNTTVGGKIAHR